jgi:hypothetical protein
MPLESVVLQRFLTCYSRAGTEPRTQISRLRGEDFDQLNYPGIFMRSHGPEPVIREVPSMALFT